MAAIDAVKVLTDDEVNRLLVLSQQNTGPSFGYTHELCVGIALLCQTVRTAWKQRDDALHNEYVLRQAAETAQAWIARVSNQYILGVDDPHDAMAQLRTALQGKAERG